MRIGFFVLCFLVLSLPLFAQHKLLQSGPMLGYSEMREAALWVQTKEPATVSFTYWEQGKPDARHSTEEIRTEKKYAYTAHLTADDVEPGRKYDYQLVIDGDVVSFPYPLTFQTIPQWEYRSDPPDFSFATGSCMYVNEPEYDRPGTPYGSEYEIWNAVYEKQADFMLWLGDNVYLREPDWNSMTGILKRYTHSRSLPELQRVLASMHNYAIWDDHDYGPNDSDRGYIHKGKTFEAFKMFFVNPTYGFYDTPAAVTQFQWGDVDFFLLDDRTFRSPNKRKYNDREIFGKEQLEWLIDALSSSRAAFKIIAAGGQMLNPNPVYENFSTYPEEYNFLLKQIKQENIEGVLFLTGDRHHSEITKMERRGDYPLYEITISPFTAGVHKDAAEEQNPMRVPGTLSVEHNFGVFSFSGPKTDRVLTIKDYGTTGAEIWSYTIHANELKKNPVTK